MSPVIDSVERHRGRLAALWMCVAVAAAVFVSPPAARAEAEDEPAEFAMEDIPWIAITDADGANMHRLAHRLTQFEKQGSPSWSGDGEQIAFDGWSPQNGERFANTKIIVTNVDGTNARILIDGCMPSFSPTEKRIAFSRHRPNPGIWIVDAESPERELRLIDPKGWGVDWSPDGKRLVYSWKTPAGANLTVVDLADGTRHDIFEGEQTRYRTIDFNFAWSADSQNIVFRGITPDYKQEIALVNVKGASHGLSTREHLPFADGHFSWSADGSQILFAVAPSRRKPRQMMVFDPQKPDVPRRLAKQDPDYDYLDPSFSPDGRKIAVVVKKLIKADGK